MAYATFHFYCDSYGGDAIPQAEFEKYGARATDYIDAVTHGRARGYADREDELKRACCAVAEAIKLNEEGGGVVAESVGKLTRNYAAGVTNTPSEEERLAIAVCRYLMHTGLLYLGV